MKVNSSTKLGIRSSPTQTKPKRRRMASKPLGKRRHKKFKIDNTLSRVKVVQNQTELSKTDLANAIGITHSDDN